MTGPETLRIDRMILREIRLELREPFRISSGLMSNRRIALLELFDAEGARTWSECVAFQLPIVLRLVRRLGGRIKARAPHSGGTVFSLSLPVKEAVAAQ